MHNEQNLKTKRASLFKRNSVLVYEVDVLLGEEVFSIAGDRHVNHPPKGKLP